ncbi:unnamed protein product [Brachionus calyciflorus]|uniref:Uncharacterized protein n=1 Tax=Brachionus calyciflorus TaxID=104777 RepID=A0A813N7H5_9BILA|nr:unnamed protein product [Brachionus calyciflorus]
MSLLKYFGKFLSKYQEGEDEESLDLPEKIKSKPQSNLIATTTIINKKKISRVYHSYSGLEYPITIHKNIYRRQNKQKTRLLPIAESSAITSESLCSPCNEKRKRPIKYCKCCGNEITKKVYFEDKKKIMAPKKCYLMFSENERLYRQRHFSSKKNLPLTQIEKFKHVSTRDHDDERNQIAKTCMKKSKALTNIKQIEYKSFLSKKRKYSSTLSSTMQDNSDFSRKSKQFKPKIDSIVESTCLDQKISSTFVVDFASTPIKLAPKTSTPVKLRRY